VLTFARSYLLLLLSPVTLACAGDDAASDTDADTTTSSSSSTTAGATGSTSATSATSSAGATSTPGSGTDAHTSAETSAATDSDTGTTTTTDTDTDTTDTTTEDADTCGDGVLDPGEQCDDGDQIDDDECTNKCTKTTCYDKKKNNSETDVDCGGGCAPCGLDGACESDSDCKSGACEAGACASLLDLPACPDQAVDAALVHKQVIAPTCGPACHLGDASSGSLNLKDAAALKDNTVALPSIQSLFDRVVPGVPDESYLVYKILGQHAKAPGGGGAAMPIGAPLSNAQRCLIVNWVKGGAL
jgi:cysteine-rich repeat protein